MPIIHDVEGSICQRIHELAIEPQVLNRKDHRCPCRTPKCRAEIVYLPQRMRAYNQQLPSVIYFKNKAGKIQVATSSEDPTPKGYDRCEANTLGELRSIEKLLTREELDKREKFIEREQAHSEAITRERRKDLRTDMESMSEKGKDFARAAMRYNDNRKNIYDKKVDPNVYFPILHNDGGRWRK